MMTSLQRIACYPLALLVPIFVLAGAGCAREAGSDDDEIQTGDQTLEETAEATEAWAHGGGHGADVGFGHGFNGRSFCLPGGVGHGFYGGRIASGFYSGGFAPGFYGSGFAPGYGCGSGAGVGCDLARCPARP